MTDITIRSEALNMEITAFVCCGNIEDLTFPRSGNSLPQSMFNKVLGNLSDVARIHDAANEAAYDAQWN